MTYPRYRSRTFKRTYKTTPGHSTKVSYKRPNPKAPSCAITNQKLHGIPRFRQGKFSSLSKSKKRPNRKFGGTYSHTAVKRAIKRSIWIKN